MDVKVSAVPVTWQKEANIVIGQSHFIKTAEDIAEIMGSSVPGARYGLAFCEASGPCLIRTEGNDTGLIADAVRAAQDVAAGHSFFLVLAGAYPINVLNQIKSCQEVCRIFCASANPVQVLVGSTDQGRGILGVVDGFAPKGVENDIEKAERRSILRKFGYKF
ncbi:MAG TPA: adenosine-specific kinase [Spirochaetia bacterium]|nr:adenosine-specific kinase [Spirochaetia bacterium]